MVLPAGIPSTAWCDTRTVRLRRWTLFSLLAGAFLVTCRREAPPPGASAAPAVSATAREDSVEITLTARPGRIQQNERLEVSVEASAPRGVTVRADNYESALRSSDDALDYRVVSRHVREAVPGDQDRLTWRYVYGLEFVLAGEYELPAASLSFEVLPGAADADSTDLVAASTEAHTGTLVTDPVRIVVAAPAGESLSEAELRTIRTLDAVELPTRWSRWWWLGPVLAAGAALVLFAFVVLARRLFPRLYAWLRRRLARVLSRKVTQEPPVPAHVWAQHALASLIAEDLLGRGMFRQFYYRVSGIVRGYIGRRYRVRAEEMTTEEFLAAAASDGRFGDSLTRELQEFLARCDRVKYARHRPDPQEPDGLLRVAGDLVERTRERDETPGTEEETAHVSATDTSTERAA